MHSLGFSATIRINIRFNVPLNRSTKLAHALYKLVFITCIPNRLYTLFIMSLFKLIPLSTVIILGIPNLVNIVNNSCAIVTLSMFFRQTASQYLDTESMRVSMYLCPLLELGLISPIKSIYM